MPKPAGQDIKVQTMEAEKRIMEQNQAQSQAAYEQVKPFYSAMLQLGLKPEEFMNSALGQGLLAQMLPALNKTYGQARNNLVEGAGAAGQFGGGTLAGPLAGLGRAQAGDLSSLYQQLPFQAVNLGLQGAAGLTQQQQILNPLGWGSEVGSAQIPQGTFWSEGLGKAIGQLGVNIGTMGASKLMGLEGSKS